LRVLIVCEYYPRRHDPVLGVWAHRQAMAARDAGAEVEVVVLHRPVPPAAELRSGAAWRRAVSQPGTEVRDGILVHYVRYLSPPRGSSYQHWGSYAAPVLRRRLWAIRKRFPYELVHAHYAVPAADAALRAGIDVPLVVSEHGGDIFHTIRLPGGEERVRSVFAQARIVLANSDGVERAVQSLGARDTRVVALGADPVVTEAAKPEQPTLVTVAHLIPRKRHADVLRALWILRDRKPDLRYRIVGDGPARADLEAITAKLGLTDRVEFTGQLPHEEAVQAGREGSIFVMPSVDEAFGVAYVEAMAAGRPAIGSRGEPGPEHLAARTIGMRLVSPGEPEALATEIAELLEPRWGARVRQAARTTMADQFTWEACGKATVAVYEEALTPR
jgi:glycosyltransferase involved in cell wall biosynthesis